MTGIVPEKAFSIVNVSASLRKIRNPSSHFDRVAVISTGLPRQRVFGETPIRPSSRSSVLNGLAINSRPSGVVRERGLEAHVARAVGPSGDEWAAAGVGAAWAAVDRQSDAGRGHPAHAGAISTAAKSETPRSSTSPPEPRAVSIRVQLGGKERNRRRRDHLAPVQSYRRNEWKADSPAGDSESTHRTLNADHTELGRFRSFCVEIKPATVLGRKRPPAHLISRRRRLQAYGNQDCTKR
jgi:hypothetical protein